MKAKAVYKMRKVFNEKKMKRWFDAMVIKTLGMRVRDGKMKRVVALRGVVRKRVAKISERILDAFKRNHK